jgi:hypothetical protein
MALCISKNVVIMAFFIPIAWLIHIGISSADRCQIYQCLSCRKNRDLFSITMSSNSVLSWDSRNYTESIALSTLLCRNSFIDIWISIPEHCARILFDSIRISRSRTDELGRGRTSHVPKANRNCLAWRNTRTRTLLSG